MSDSQEDLVAASSGEANFLVALKQELKDNGLYNSLTAELETYMRNGIPAVLHELKGYYKTGIPVIATPDDCDTAIGCVGNLQANLDRVTAIYVQHLEWYRLLKEARQNAANYLVVGVKEVKALKSADLRQAATNYVMQDFDTYIGRLDDLYDMLDQCRTNINRALANVRLELDLYATKGSLMMGSGRVSQSTGNGSQLRRGV